jgi:PGF-CTERM protein
MSLYDDGYADCEDGSDEPNGTGSGDTFICDDGEEIPMDYYDDGDADCEDGSDEPNGTDNEEEEEIEFVSHDMDIWFEQWDDESMEFVMVNRMVIDDSEAIALYAMMADMFLGNNDGEVSQDEVDSFIEMMNEETDDEGVNEAMMQLDGAPGTMVDTWMEIEGLVGIDESNVNESEIVMIMVEVVAFDTTAYADSTTHIFTIDDDDDGDSSEEPVPDEGCDIDSIWIHNSDTWSVSSITDSASTMAFTYEDFNNAWFTEDCPDDSGIVTFNLVKTDGGELPDATEDNDWEDLDTNRFPICAYAYAMMLPDGEFDVRVGIGAAPESGDYIIDLVDGAKYMISVVCSDPEGEDMTVTINNADLNLTSTYTSTATAEASLMLSVPAGYDGTYVFDVTWTDGYHVESGNLTIIGLGDGSNDDDISADGDGFLPGFTAALGIVALLGAAMIGSRRNRA